MVRPKTPAPMIAMGSDLEVDTIVMVHAGTIESGRERKSQLK